MKSYLATIKDGLVTWSEDGLIQSFTIPDAPKGYLLGVAYTNEAGEFAEFRAGDNVLTCHGQNKIAEGLKFFPATAGGYQINYTNDDGEKAVIAMRDGVRGMYQGRVIFASDGRFLRFESTNFNYEAKD